MYVMGDNGVFGKASQAKVQTELGKIEEQAGTIYYDMLMKNQGTSNKVTNRAIVEELINKGNKIEIRSAGAGSVTGISVEPAEVSIDQNKTAKIKVSLEEAEDRNVYYAVIDGKHYKMNFQNNALTIDKEASDHLEGNAEETAKIEIETGYDTTIVTNAQISQSEKTIEITCGTKIGNTEITVKCESKTATCTVNVKEAESNWEEIAEIAKAIANDSSITNSSSQATVNVNGASKTITVGEIYKVKYDGTIRRVRVLGFKHDDLVNTGVYEGNHSKASISFDFVDCIGNYQMNATSENGWEATEMRTYLEGANGREKLSNNSYIKQVKKQYIKTYNSASSVTTCEDYLWLLSCSEIVPDGYNGGNTRGGAITKEGEQYLYYKNYANQSWQKGSQNRIKYHESSTIINWWLRSPHSSDNRLFSCILYTGSCNGFSSYTSLFVAPGFCI